MHVQTRPQACRPLSSPPASPRAETRHEPAATSRLAAIEAEHPDLDGEIDKWRQDAAEMKAGQQWSGLKWYEKAVFFIPPFGPLLGVGVIQGNRLSEVHSLMKVDELSKLAAERNRLRRDIIV